MNIQTEFGGGCQNSMTLERFLVIGDPHFREGVVREMELFVEEVLRIVTEQIDKIDYIVVLGDVMDRHGILHQKPYHQSCKFLIDLAKLLPTYCLIGNHDFDIPSKYLPPNHPYKVMTWTPIDNLYIIDKPTIVNNKLFSPYVPPGMFNRAIADALGIENFGEICGWEELVKRDVGLIFAHQEFLGCQMGRLKSEHGDPWPEGNYGSVPFIVSGHIHDHQMVGENIMYTGTPIQVNYGEGVKKGICIITMTLDPLPKTHSVEWFPIRVPKKVLKTLSVDELDEWVGRRFKTLLEKYNLTIPALTVAKKQQLKSEFENITRLHANKDRLESLVREVQNDKFCDQIRLQVTSNGKISNTILKNIVLKVREIPLGVQQVFFTEVLEERPPGNIEQTETVKQGWLDILLERVGDNPNKKECLRDILYNLSNKV